MSNRKSKKFDCEECGKPTFVPDIGSYQFKYQERIGSKSKKQHYFCSDKCKKKWTTEHITIPESIIRCPYYHSNSNKTVSIICEPIAENSKCTKVYFENSKIKKEYMQKHCCKNFNNCTLVKKIRNK